MAKMCETRGVNHHLASFPENRSIDLNKVEDLLARDSTYTNVVSIFSFFKSKTKIF